MAQKLNDHQIQQFISEGYIKLEDAFPYDLAEAGRNILWKDTGCNPNDPGTWTQPVIRLGDYAQQPFQQAANTPLLHAAFDQLVGAGRWLPRNSLGTIPVRFPNRKEPGDTGWHVDASFPGEDPSDFLSWRINIRSKGRALLMLFLFSDVDEADAPTRIRAGSTWILPACWSRTEKQACPAWSFPASFLLPPAGKKCWPPAGRALFFFAILFWCMLPSPIMGRIPALWRSPRFIRHRNFSLRGGMKVILLWKLLSGKEWDRGNIAVRALCPTTAIRFMQERLYYFNLSNFYFK
jgi:hypothetical protein